MLLNSWLRIQNLNVHHYVLSQPNVLGLHAKGHLMLFEDFQKGTFVLTGQMVELKFRKKFLFGIWCDIL